MKGRYLVDTNVVIRLFAEDAAVKRRFEEGTSILLGAVVLGELYFGAAKSKRRQENLRQLDQFAEKVAVLACDSLTARHYGEIREELRRKGRPIPENDCWLAALARQHGLVVVSGDRHFSMVDGLVVEDW